MSDPRGGIRLSPWTVAWLVLAGFVLLFPSRGTPDGADAIPSFCLLCGSRVLADALLNVAFFVPIGWALARRWGWRAACGVALAMTLSIEVLQVWIPGRFPTAADVLSNLSGAALGAWLHGRERKILPALSAGAVLAVVAPLALLAPTAPDGVYYGQWTAQFGDMAHYEGQVLAASVDGIDVPSRRSERSEELRRALRSRAPLDVEFVAGPAPDGLAPLFSIFDARRRRIFLLGVDDQDVVVRGWTRATDLRLDSPEVRWPGMLDGVAPGDTVRMGLTRENRGWCLAIEEKTRCETTAGVGGGWTLLFSPDGLTALQTASIGILWMLGLGVLLGLAPGSATLRLLLAIIMMVVSSTVSANLSYVRGSLPEAAALIMGVVFGLIIRRRIGVR